MPWLNGVRVSYEEFAKHQKPSPLYRYDVDGDKRIVNQADLDRWAEAHPNDDPRPKPVRKAAREPMAAERALNAVANALGVARDDPAMADVDVTRGIEFTAAGNPIDRKRPWLSDVPADQREELEYEDPEPEPRPASPEPRPASPEPKAPTYRAKEEAFIASKGIKPTSLRKRKRKAQTPEGRRARYIRAKAARLGINIKEAELLTPLRPRKETS